MNLVPRFAMRPGREIEAGSLDLADLLQPGDHVVCGQMAGEPRTLTEALAAQRSSLPDLQVFLGVQQTATFGAETADRLRFASFGAMEQTRRLAGTGALDIIPESLRHIGLALERGDMRCDVVLLQLSTGCRGSRHDGSGLSFGVTNDLLQPAMARARLVIAEVNDQAPWTYCDRVVAPDEIDLVVRTSRPLPETGNTGGGPVERAIASHCARFVDDGSCIQVGIGALPDAILAELGDRRELGFHSGLLGDGAMALIERGVITNSRKPIDRGVTVTGMASGSAQLYRFLHGNAAVRVSSTLYTHALSTLARLDDLVCINSALEVDLLGAVNSESINGRWLGGTGGLPDFVAGARGASGGRSIIALPSTTPDCRRSRVVARLNGPATLSRNLADVIVTEHGVAELRGQGLRERARRMIAIAAPEFQDDLAAELAQIEELI